MSNFFNWWVIVITLVNIFACYWLIQWTMKKRPEESEVGDTTGHSWDGLQEFNNPLPKWWLWMFYITIVFGLTYLVIFPGLGNFQGVKGWSSHGQYDQEVSEADAKYGPIFKKFASTAIPALAKDADAMKAGKRLFSNYCSQCHGSDAKGTTGFPNLTDNDWLYGGSPEQIKATIMNGRNGVMPAWGAPLGQQGVENVAAYVQSLSGRQVDAAAAEAGKTTFQTLCVACHGPDGKGNQALGAPNLTDNIWLHGSTAASIKTTITNGRNSTMPAHNVFLGNDKVHLLAAYVYSLSH
jgi:cytochrome c oxidase cbb3-type subunit III